MIPVRAGRGDHEHKKSCARGGPEPLGGNVACSGTNDRAAAGTPGIGNVGAASGRATCRSFTGSRAAGTSSICSNCACNSRTCRCARRSGPFSGSISRSNGRPHARRGHIPAGGHGFPAASRQAGCRSTHGRHIHCRRSVACDRDWRGSLRSGCRRDWNRDRDRLQL